MALTVTHSFVSGLSDDPDSVTAGDVVPSNWNADHSLSGAVDFSELTGSATAGQLPAASLSAIGGVKAINAVSHQWIASIDTSGVPHLTQPAASDISGLAASATTDTTSASNISSGTLPAGRLPNPSASSLGGIESLAAVGSNWINAISTSGVPSATQPAFTDISGRATSSQVPTDVAYLDVADQTISGGANVTVTSLSTGNVTIDCGKCPLQKITNGGAFTITAPASDGSCMLMITNNGSAGAVAFSGFSVGSNTGDALDTTNTHVFTVSIWRINSVSGYRIAAHQ